MSKERKIDDSELTDVNGAGDLGTAETDDATFGQREQPIGGGGGGGGSGPNAPEPIGGGGSGNQTPSWDD
jgi:hypothetical protein